VVAEKLRRCCTPLATRLAVKLDLYGLKFYTQHVLKKPWVAPGLIKPPKSQRLEASQMTRLAAVIDTFEADFRAQYRGIT